MRKALMLTPAAVAAVLVLAAGGSAFAHHAFNMYLNDKYTKLTGTVKTFKWANPHSMIDFVVVDDKGGMLTWTAECSPVNMMRLKGWTSTSLKTGDKVDFVLHPNRNGVKYGLLVSATLADGSKLTDKD